MNEHTYKGITIKVEQDPDPQNPRKEYEKWTQMICFHKRHNLGDEHEYKEGMFDGWTDMQEQLCEADTVAAWQPLYLFDHSGITISTTPFSCGWDSGQVGFIIIEKEAVTECWPDGRTEEQLDEILVGDVKTYDQYLTGDVYGYVIEFPDGEEDSCWGYYGEEHCLEEAKCVVDGYWKRKHGLFTEAGIEVEVPACAVIST